MDGLQLYLLPTQGGEDDGPDDHEDGLDEVSPDDGGEAPGHREQRGDGEQDQDGDVDGAVTLEPGGLRDEESARVQVSLGAASRVSRHPVPGIICRLLLTEILVKT